MKKEEIEEEEKEEAKSENMAKNEENPEVEEPIANWLELESSTNPFVPTKASGAPEVATESTYFLGANWASKVGAL